VHPERFANLSLIGKIEAEGIRFGGGDQVRMTRELVAKGEAVLALARAHPGHRNAATSRPDADPDRRLDPSAAYRTA
jgi:hypothetical protein